MTRFALRAAFAAAILSCSWASSLLAADAVKDAPITLPEQTIVKLSDEALGPFVWGWEGSLKISDELFTKAAAKRDPLVLFRLAFRLMREESQTGSKEAGALARKILDYMIDEYQPADRGDAGIHWKYGFDYEGIKAGWWSGMDAFFGPMTLYAAWQQYGVERYKDVALKSVKLGLRSPQNGGALWKSREGCWVSEYTWSGMKRSDEFQVLNGHLFGLQALYILAALTRDKDLVEAYECGRQGSAASEQSFYTKGKNWSWYQTTPPVINPTHYLLFEGIQYKALQTLTGDKFWQSGYDQRSAIFLKAYRPEVVKTPGGEYRVELSMIGAPHPYWPDTYPLELNCKIGSKSYTTYSRRQYWKHLPYAERFILSLGLPNIPDSCQVSMDAFPGGKSLIYEVSELTLSPAQKPMSLSVEPAISYNAIKQGDQKGDVTIDPVAGAIEGRIELKVDRQLTVVDTLAIVVESQQDTQIGFLMEGENGKVAKRDYNDIVAGKPNIILLNRTGFTNQESVGDRVKSLTFRVHSGKNTKKFQFNVKAFELIQSPSQMEDFLIRNEKAHFQIQ